jgi:hypothetical protein
MLIVGTSVPTFLLELNFIQIILHSMGVVFTTWFLLDTWRYTVLWALWAVFAVTVFLVELFTIQQAAKLRSDIKKNQNGDSRFI